MKKVTRNSLLLMVLIALTVSCKPAITVQTDYDRAANFTAYKTFSLYYLVSSKAINQLNEERIWNAIKAEMIKKGYRENDRNPDLVINAISVLKNKRYVSASTNVYGYGGVAWPYGYWAAGPGMVSRQTTVQAHHYKDGSLLIDVVDAKTKKLVWQGTAAAEITRQPGDPDKAIREAVSKVMAGFPHQAMQQQ